MRRNVPTDETAGRVPDHYRQRIDRSRAVDAGETELRASVVLVTYRTEAAELQRTLDSLTNQTTSEFEVIVIDNNHRGNLDSVVDRYDVVRRYVKLQGNCGITFGRNLGARLARSDLLVFLDDDGVPQRDFVEQHVLAHRERDIVAARGKVLPRSENVYNRLQWWYDLGDEPFPFYVNTEGNSSFDRDTFVGLSGFDEELVGRAGHEGVELTYRLIEAGHDTNEIIYLPDAIIYHDNADGLRSYLYKQIRNKRTARLVRTKHPDLVEFLESYPEPPTAAPERGITDSIAALTLAGVVEIADVVLPKSTF